MEKRNENGNGLKDSDQLEWIELSPDTKYQDPAQGGGSDGDENENPLG